MVNFLKKRIKMLIDGLAQYERLRDNAENEDQAMSCGSFNPRFLAKIKRSKIDCNKTMSKEI
jgi:hypothetical protein